MFVIAEAGVNHCGSVERARAMVKVAADAGADAIKFQLFSADKIVSRRTQLAAYQKANAGEFNSQFEMLRALELSHAAHVELAKLCRKHRIAFMSTAFDLDNLKFLAGLNVHAIKIASGDLTFAPLLLAAARTGKPVILSTGMSNLAEIEEALGVLAFGLLKLPRPPSRAAFRSAFRGVAGLRALQKNVTLLHCVTEYPAPSADANLRAMDTLQTRFQLPVGYSDHTLGINIALASVARGATVLEKHFTLDRKLPGPDHRASLEPPELASLIAGVRQIEVALGDGKKTPRSSEIKNISIARRSIVAATTIRAGENFSQKNLTFKRPAHGQAPIEFWGLLGKPAKRAFRKDDEVA